MIINLLNVSSDEESKFFQKKWYVIDSQVAKVKCNTNHSIKFEAESIESGFCDYSGAFVLVTGNISVDADNNTTLHLKMHYFPHARQKLMKQIIFTL